MPPQPEFTKRIQDLFTVILRYHFTRRISFGKRKTQFGNYASMTFKKAESSPLALLLKEQLIAEPKAIEVLVKDDPDQAISDTDLEAVIMSVREEPDTLFILASPEETHSDDIPRLFRAFTRNQVVVLPIGKKEIAQFEKWIEKGNLNAFIVRLLMLADELTSGDEKLFGPYKYRQERQQEANFTRLSKMGGLAGPQTRTLVKKLSFLLSFEREGSDITKTAARTKIERKTVYNWIEKDPAFRKLLYLED